MWRLQGSSLLRRKEYCRAVRSRGQGGLEKRAVFERRNLRGIEGEGGAAEIRGICGVVADTV